ncbi:MAG TPA: hypothetical protein VII73_03025 [Caulobacteraceae bacterium]
MGRPGRLTDGAFTSREVAAASGLSARNFALLTDEDLAPSAMESGGGRAGHRTYDAAALSHAALLGALHLAGLELLVSGRLAKAFADQFNATYGKLPTNLTSLLRSKACVAQKWRPWHDQADGAPPDLENDFWLHTQLRRHADFYPRGQAMRGDFVVDIADHAYVSTEFAGLEGLKIHSPVSDPLTFNPEFRIEGRGSQARILPVHEEVDDCDFHANPVSAAQLRVLQAAYAIARDNAVTRVRINMSLAIRNAFDVAFEGRRQIAA